MVDLAVPRDIGGRGRAARDVSTPSTTSSAVVQTAGESARPAVAQAEAIIELRVQNFVHWLDQRATVPLIRSLNAQADGGASTSWPVRKLLARGDSPDEALEALARGLTQKMLHGAMAELPQRRPAAARADDRRGHAAVPARRNPTR